jgi:hypothetical protein
MRSDDIRYNRYIGNESTHFAAGGIQQFSQFPKPFTSQVTQLPAMGSLYRFIEPG